MDIEDSSILKEQVEVVDFETLGIRSLEKDEGRENQVQINEARFNKPKKDNTDIDKKENSSDVEMKHSPEIVLENVESGDIQSLNHKIDACGINKKNTGRRHGIKRDNEENADSHFEDLQCSSKNISGNIESSCFTPHCDNDRIMTRKAISKKFKKTEKTSPHEKGVTCKNLVMDSYSEDLQCSSNNKSGNIEWSSFTQYCDNDRIMTRKATCISKRFKKTEKSLTREKGTTRKKAVKTNTFIYPRKRKRNDITLRDKYDIVKLLDKGHKQCDISRNLNLTKTQVSRINSNKEKICQAVESNGNTKRKRIITGKDAEVEKALAEWFKNARLRDIQLSGPILTEKAKELAKQLNKPDFVPTAGWMERWKDRNNIVFSEMQGDKKAHEDKQANREKKDADKEVTDNWTTTILPDILQSYKGDNIYNASEAGIYYRAVPNGNLVDKRVKVTDSKRLKDYITVFVAVNMTGTDKRPMLVIGKDKDPRCLCGVKQKTITYHSNPNALMTPYIFTQWLKTFNQDMIDQKRKVILLVDSCSTHPKSAGNELSNISLKYMPPNTTSLIRPFDEGILHSLKSHCRSRIIRKIINEIDTITENELTASHLPHDLSLLVALHLLKEAWNAVTTTTITECLKKGGIILQKSDTAIKGQNTDEVSLQPPTVSSEEFGQYIDIDTSVPCTGLQSDQDICGSILSERIENNKDQDGTCSDSEEVPQAICPSSSELLKALQTLRQGLEFGNVKDYTYYNKVEDQIKGIIKQYTL